LILAADALLDKEKQREKIIILITDGTANKGVTPEIAMKLLQDRKIKTYTIGVGKKESTTIDVVV
jgi:Mg-chelatase subunit ChlD